MGYAWTLGMRYLRGKKRSFISVGTLFAILGVALGVAALATVMSVTGGFHKEFRDKVLGVNAHVLVLKRTPEFAEYRKVMEVAKRTPHVTGVAPFIINPMLVTAGERTATGVLMKGIDPQLMPSVLDLPKHVVEGSLDGLRRPGAKPAERPKSSFSSAYDDPEPSPSASASTREPGAESAPPSPSAAPSASATTAAAATSDDPFVRLMERSLAAKKRENAALNAAEDRAAESEKIAAAASASASANVPSGDVTPEHGYDSSLPPDDVEDKQVAAISKADDLAIADKDLPGVAIGRTLATSLKLKLGDRLRITSPAVGFALGGKNTPVARAFRVIAIFEAGFDQYDSKLVYVDLYEAEQFYDQGDSVTGVEMRIDDIDKSRNVRDAITGSLDDSRYHVMDWMDLNRPLFTALLIQQIGMSSVLALIIVVAAFTVIASLIMIVLDKRKEIAVLKAMGARDGAILRAFLYQGLVIGMVGTGIGLAIGLIVCKGLLVYSFPLDPKVYFISHLPVDVRMGEFMVTALVAVLICLGATIVPALHAASIRPADGLRAQ
jgi:lipoprotein-releasing system permease protein